MSKRDRQEPTSVYNVWTSYNAGKAFCANAGDFFSKLPPDIDAAANVAVHNMGRLIASITNLALGIELYLKCLALLTHSKVRPTHDLLLLFDALPEQVRLSLEVVYKRKIEYLPAKGAVGFVVSLSMGGTRHLSVESQAVSLTGDQRSRGLANRKSGKDSLRTLLENERDVFNTWRYLHEGGKEHEPNQYEVEHLFLGVFASVLEEHIETRTPRMRPR